MSKERMNRRGFMKMFGIASAAVAVAPRVLAETQRYPYTCLDGKLTIFEERRQGYDYTIGVDVGGLNSPTCFSVMRVETMDEPCEQVAEYVSEGLRASEISRNLASTAWMYAENLEDNETWPMLVVEQVRSPGDHVQHIMKVLGFKRFFRPAINGSLAKKEGWYTTRISYPILIGQFTRGYSLRWYIANSAPLKRSISKRKSDKDLIDNPYSMAAALSYIGACQGVNADA